MSVVHSSLSCITTHGHGRFKKQLMGKHCGRRCFTSRTYRMTVRTHVDVLMCESNYLSSLNMQSNGQLAASSLEPPMRCTPKVDGHEGRVQSGGNHFPPHLRSLSPNPAELLPTFHCSHSHPAELASPPFSTCFFAFLHLFMVILHFPYLYPNSTYAGTSTPLPPPWPPCPPLS